VWNSGGNLSAGNLIKYWKKPEQSSYQERREKRAMVFKLLFCIIMEKSKLLNPRVAG
jgi:hypothetical protein